MGFELRGQVLHEGSGQGEALVLDEPLSFWGGFDPVTGCIIDAHHPQVGLCVADRVLVVSETRGSAATPGRHRRSGPPRYGPCSHRADKAGCERCSRCHDCFGSLR